MNPAGRMCTLEEVARFVSTRVGDETEWFNGATIDFTGGMTLRLLALLGGGERPLQARGQAAPLLHSGGAER